MDSILSYFSNKNDKPQSEPQNKEITNCQKSQIQLQEIQCEDQNLQDQPKNKNKQTQPQSNEQKSMSSGDFEEINQNQDSDTKKNHKNIGNQMQQSGMSFNMQDTMDFCEDDINQSISESNLHKRNKKPKPKKIPNQMSFSDINELNQNEQQQEQTIQKEKQKQPNEVQYPSISLRQQDCSGKMQQSFQDLSIRNPKKKSKNSNINMQQVSKFLNLQENEQDSLPYLQEKDKNTPQKQKFKFVKNQQKVSNENIRPKEEKLTDQNSQSDDQNIMIDVSKSMIAEKIKPIGQKGSEKKSSPNKQKHYKDNKKSTKKHQQQQNQCVNMQESYYMPKIPQKPAKASSIKNLNQQQQTSPEFPFFIYVKDSLFFIKYRDTPDRRLTQKIFQSLTEHFLMENIMLPFFSHKLLEQHEKEIQMGVKKQKQQLFSFYANTYFQFLQKRYGEQTKQFFQKEIQKAHLKSKIMDTEIGIKKEETLMNLGTFYQKVIDYFKLSHYSKAQILKQFLESQLALICQFQENWVSSSEQISQKSKISSEQKVNIKNENTFLEQKSLSLLQEIAGLQLLISFERSEMYCDKKLKESLEEKIWKQRKKKLIQDRNWFISNLFSQCKL